MTYPTNVPAGQIYNVPATGLTGLTSKLDPLNPIADISTTNTASQNTVALQKMLTDYAAAKKPLIINGKPSDIIYINDTLILDDYTDFTCYPIIKMADGISARPTIVTRAYGRADINVTTLTSAIVSDTVVGTAVLASALDVNVGDYVCINWAVPAWYNGVHRVKTVNVAGAATTITFNLLCNPSAATASISTGSTYGGGYVPNAIKIRKASVNISLNAIGGIDYNSANRTADGTKNCNTVILSHAYNVSASGSFLNAWKFNLHVACVNRFRALGELYFEGPSDGLHFCGPAWDCKVGTVTGYGNGDDLCGVGADDWAGFDISEGEVDVQVDRISTNGALKQCNVWGSSNGYHTARLHAGQIVGTTTSVAVAASAGADLQIDDYQATTSNSIVCSLNGNISRAKITGQWEVGVTAQSFVYISAVTNQYADFSFDIKGKSQSGYTSQKFLNLDMAGATADLTVNCYNCVFDSNFNGLGVLNAAAEAVRAVTVNFFGGIFKPSNFLINQTTKHTVTLRFMGAVLVPAVQLATNAGTGDLNFIATYCDINSGGNMHINNSSSGNINIRTSNNRILGTGTISNTGAGKVRVYSDDFGYDVSAAYIDQTVTGQYAISTTAGTNKQGKAIKVNANPTNTWYALATGAAGVNTPIL